MTVMSIAQGLRDTAPAHRFASETHSAAQGPPAALSEAAATAARGAGTLRPVAGTGGKTFRVDAFAGVLTRKTAAFSEEPALRLALSDAAARQPVTLDVDAEGRVTMAGDHPGKAAVERLFAGDPEVANRYREIAGSNGTSLDQVQALAGKQLIERTPAGQYVLSGGRWVRK